MHTRVSSSAHILFKNIVPALSLFFLAHSAHAAGFNNWSSNGPTPTKSVIKTVKVSATRVYAGSDGGGFHSLAVSAGTAWTATNNGITNRQLQSITLSPTDSNLVYIGTKSGLFKSTGAGASWVASSSGLTTAAQLDVRAIAVNPVTTATLYAATADGVFGSTDDGSTWTPANSAPLNSDVRGLVIDPATPSIFYAATAGGVYRSADSGASWTAKNGSLGDLDVRSLLVHPLTPASLYASTAGGIYRTSDSGDNWVAISTGLPASAILTTAFATSPTVTVPLPKLLAGTSGSGLYASVDDGTTWTPVATLPAPITVYEIARLSGSSTTLYAATDFGVYRSLDSGVTWASFSSGLIQGKAVLVNPYDPTVLVAGFNGGGLYYSTDSGASWTQTATSSATSLFATSFAWHSSGSPVYAGTGSGVYSSSDNGQTWSAMNSGLTVTDVRTLAIDSANTLYAGTAAGVFSWNGVTWSIFNPATMGNKDIASLAFKGADLYAGSNGGGIYKATPPGTWTQLNNGLGVDTAINAVAADAGTVYAGTNSGVYRSTNDGANWNVVLQGIPARTLATNSTPLFVIAGTIGSGVYFSTNSGVAWTPLNADLRNLRVNGVATASGTNPSLIYAVTEGIGVYYLSAAPEPVVTVDGGPATNPVPYGKVNVTDTGTKIFTITNRGALQLSISGIVTSGTDSALFSVVAGGDRQCSLAGLPAVTILLNAGDYCTFAAEFTPSAPGTKTATLTISYAAPLQSSVINLQGDAGYPPQAVITAPLDGATFRTPVTVSGTALTDSSGAPIAPELIQTVAVSTDNGTTWTTATRGADWSSWSYTWPAAPPQPVSGIYVIRSRATGTDGFVQTSEVNAKVTVTVDNTPPDTTIGSRPASPSNTNTPTFTFTSSKPGPNATFECSLDSGTYAACTSGTPLAALPDGSHTFTVRAYDGVSPSPGNVDPTPATYTWSIDTTPPITSISSKPPLFSNSTNASLVFGASEPNCTFSCTYTDTAGSTFGPSPCTSPYSRTTLAEGNHTFTVRATDPAGNQELAAISYPWTVDTTLPLSNIFQPPAQISGTIYSFTGTASDALSGISQVQVTFDNGTTWTAASDTAFAPAPPWSSWSYFWTLPANGIYTVQTRAIDRAGNIQSPTASITASVANPPPIVAITYPASNGIIGGPSSKTVTGTAAADPGGLPLQKVQFASALSPTPPASPTWLDATGSSAWSFPWNPTTDGVYTIMARSIDTSNNSSIPVSQTVTVDLTPPTSSITALSNPFVNSNVIQLTVTASDNLSGVQTVNITITDAASVSTTSPATFNAVTGNWTFTSGNLADGSYLISSRATDRAGNLQAPSTTPYLVTIDNVAPVTTITGRPVNPSNSSAPVFTFSANETSTFICTFDAVSAPCTSPVSYSGKSTGTHTFTVQATDRAGNVEIVPASYTWFIDLIPPMVTSVTPPDGATRVSIFAPGISVTFDKALNPATVTPATFFLRNGGVNVPGTVTVNATNTGATFTPSANLAYAGNFTVTVTTGILDPAGNPLAASFSWSFSTDPEGDINLDGRVDIADAIMALQVAVGRTTLTSTLFRHGDVAPLSGGKPLPDGIIDGRDAMVILGKSIGKHNW